jgi:hypothetical protein
MGNKVIVRSGNADGSRIITIPIEICDMFEIDIGSELELAHFASYSFQLRTIK